MIRSFTENYPNLNTKRHVGIYVYSMHIVDMYSILHYAISFLMKKTASYKNVLDSYITFLFAYYWLLTGFFNFFF